MRCVASVSYTIGINRGSSASFIPTRGLCQGDCEKYLVGNILGVRVVGKNEKGSLCIMWTDFRINLRVGTCNSYQWEGKSILNTIGLLEKGLGGRIGTGESVKIWNDCWIPRPSDGRINCQTIDIRYSKVAYLIKFDSCTLWEDMIRDIADVDQAERILAIPISKSKPPDTMEEGERVDHLLRFCSVTCQILNVLKVVVLPVSKYSNYKTCLVKTFHNTDNRTRKLLAIVFWAIWFIRNRLVHEGIRKTVNELLGFMSGYLQEIDALEFAKSINFYPEQTFWKPPDLRFIKLNFDASYNVVLKTYISRILARDEMGQIMVLVLTDMLIFQMLLLLRPEHLNEQSSLRLTLGFDMFRLKGIHYPSACKKEANVAAHVLAKEGRRFSEERYWVEEAPEVVERMTAVDWSNWMSKL
ncbi:hypothetical protein CXB51_026235 [Gossypium anomalum]|uniref:RNase H type-1 domain-containing protein n=1 Tax=Gossypium anomalum TaxID=47600 RepID=A0A8J5YB68_9ROSI|nr:hypothetical protein CXB51_026235 [Gossypium anomalum]